MKKRILSLMLAAVLVMSTLSACGSKDKAAGDTATTETTQTEEATTETAGEDQTQTGGDTPLVAGYATFSEKFSPFFAESVPDQDVMRMSQLMLIEQERSGAPVLKGIEGETHSFNGADYTYTGATDVTITQNPNDTVYNFKLREDLTFSDGEPITADDVIFSLYVFASSDYDGYEVLNTLPIIGLKNYQANSTAASSISADDVDKAVTAMSDELQKQVIEEVITPTLTAEKDWCIENFESMGMASGEELFVTAYALDEGYSAEGKDFDTIVSDVIAMYGADYKMLGSNYAGDEAYYAADVSKLAEAMLVQAKVDAGEGEEVPNIEGIKKIGDYEVEVTLEGFDASAIYRFIIPIAPLHYYGDKAQYDYENNQFGFTRDDLSSVKEKTTTPLGAGAYKYVKFENKTVYFEANENYFKGAPKIKSVQFKESDYSDMVPGIQQSTIDIAEPTASKLTLEQIGEINGNGETTGEKIVTVSSDFAGYGYLGLNAKTVNVGGEPGSDASKNLRKALGTVIAVYRDVSVDSYYGDAAAVINYPISNSSWAAPQKSDAGYVEAYSVDVEGNPIYTEGMTPEERYAKATEAALGFFEAAGYTVADGKLTAAPAGAKLTYEVLIGADGKGDHPTFAVLTDAKAALAEIGFTLEVNDLADSSILWDRTKAKSQEIWVAAWQSDADPDCYQIYHSESSASNHYCIADPELDGYIMDARQSADQEYRKSVYKECLNIIMDWGVEVPIYQRQNCVVYTPERINQDTMTKDITTYYKWWEDIESIEMK